MTVVEQIVARDIDAVIVYESDNVIAFADHNPINFGHILICPTFPYESFIDIPDNVNVEINQVAKDLFKRIQKLFKPDGISFLQNNGAFNELSHYHLHIFPRFNQDQFGWKSGGLGIQPTEILREKLAGL